MNGRLALAAKGIEDQQIYLNELSPAGDELYVIIKGLSTQRILVKVRTADGDWTDWVPVPGGGATDTKISPLAVRGQLYLFGKGINDRQIYVSHTP